MAGEDPSNSAQVDPDSCASSHCHRTTAKHLLKVENHTRYSINPVLTTCWDRWGILHKGDPSCRPKWHSFRNTSMYLPASKRSGKPVPPQSCTYLQSRKYSWFLHFDFIPTYLRNKVWQKAPLIFQGAGGGNYNGTPGLPSFWCDLCSLKSHLEYPSAIKRERSFLGEKNPSGHDTQKNQTTNSMDLDYTERIVCFKTVSSALVKIQSEGMRLKIKRLLGRSLRNQKQSHSRKKETSPGSWLPQGCDGCTLGTV